MSLQPTNDEFANDVLQPLPLNRFEEYRLACVDAMPDSFRGHHYLVIQEQWLQYMTAPENAKNVAQLSERCKHRVYVHRSGNANNCTIFGISEGAVDEDVSVRMSSVLDYLFAGQTPGRGP